MRYLTLVLSFFRRSVESSWAKYLAILLALVTIVLSAIQPLTYGLIPNSPEALSHLYRLIALDHAVRYSGLWSRFVPGLAYGFGAPLFNLISPLYLYPFEALHLIGFSFTNALLIGMIGYMLIATFGAFLLGRVWSSSLGGVLTAAGYLYAPYMLSVWPRSGDLSQYAALSLLPWVMWALWRLGRIGKRVDFLLTIVIYTLFLLMHTSTTLICLPLLALYVLYLWWTSPDPPTALIRLAAAAIIPLGITAFFWVPILFEASYTRIGDLATLGTNPQETIGSILHFPQTADLTRIASSIPRTLSWPLLILTFTETGFIAWQKFREGKETGHFWMIVFSLMTAICVIMATRLSMLLWMSFRPLSFLGSPHQFLGPASLLIAVLGSYSAMRVVRQITSVFGKVLWAALCVITIGAYSLPSLYGLYAPHPTATRIIDAQNFERYTGRLATGIAGEYLPIWSSESPEPDALLGLYAESDIIPRLRPSSDVTQHVMRWQASAAYLELTVERETTLIFNWLYFPGWWARIDGEIAVVSPIGPQGYLGVTVPQGDHIVEIGFGPTVLRLAAMIISGLFVLPAIIFVVIFPRRLWLPHKKPSLPDLYGTRPMLAGVILACLALFAIKALWLDHAQTPIKQARFARDISQGLQYPVEITFNHEIKLLGYDLTPQHAVAGRASDLTLYWQLADAPVQQDYSTVVYLRDSENQTLITLGSQHPGGVPTSQWIPQLYAEEHLSLHIPEGTPPGVYSLHVGLYMPNQLTGLEAFDSSGASLGITAQLGRIEVRRSSRAARLPRPSQAIGVNASMNDALSLLWVDALPEAANAGDPLTLTWAWRADLAPDQVYTAQLLWWQGDELHAASPAIAPISGYSTDQWRRRDGWLGTHNIYVPGRLETGNYEIAVLLVDAHNNAVGEPVTISEMYITAPSRRFEPPIMQIEASTVWQNLITLIGYDLPRTRIATGNNLNLTLYWQPETDINRSLAVVIQLVDGNGAVVAQQSGVPSQATRPTTGWSPNEVLGDLHAVYLPASIPAGSYRLRVGWIDAITNQQVALADGSVFWLLPQRIEVRAP